MAKRETKAFVQAARQLRKVFGRYSVHDCACALVASHLWPENVASPFKHLFAWHVLLSMDAKDLSQAVALKEYDDLCGLLSQVYGILPTFDGVEDYVPEQDWGEVRFWINKRVYRMFYGTELDMVYDQLLAFRMLATSFDGDLQERTGRSPLHELETILEVQDHVIHSLDSVVPSARQTENPGETVIPSESFWRAVADLCDEFQETLICAGDVADHLGITLGALQEPTDPRAFVSSVFEGNMLPALFLRHEARTYPILLRRSASVLLDEWSRLLAQHPDVGRADKDHLSLTNELALFVKHRLKEDDFLPLVSAIDADKNPEGPIFAGAIRSGPRLILVYLGQVVRRGDDARELLEAIRPALEQALARISGPPVRLAVHSTRQLVECGQGPTGAAPQPEILLVMPDPDTAAPTFNLPDSFPASVAPLDQFLGIVDELDSSEELARFLDYWEDLRNKLLWPAPLVDVFASFRDAHGVLVGGAQDFHGISVLPNWGSNFRFRSLERFWRAFPERGYLGDPRTWTASQETQSRVRLFARSSFDTAIVCRIGDTHLTIKCPFPEMKGDAKTMMLGDLLMQSLEDGLSRWRQLIQDHEFFQAETDVCVLLFPWSLVASLDQLRDLRRLDPAGRSWAGDIGRFAPHRTFGTRIVYNDRKVGEGFEKAETRALETSLLLFVLDKFNDHVSDERYRTWQEEIRKESDARPRHKLFTQKQRVTFPGSARVLVPATTHFKRAKKRIAELATSSDVKPRRYDHHEAKHVLNVLRDEVLRAIDREIKRYRLVHILPMLIESADALMHERWQRDALAARYGEFEMDSDPVPDDAARDSDIRWNHRTFRYLIEKCVQLEPDGKEAFGPEAGRDLLALVDWLLVMYEASDVVHYGMGPVSIVVQHDYQVDVEYPPESRDNEKSFNQEETEWKQRRQQGGTDEVRSPRSVEEFLDELDSAFRADFGFTVRHMTRVLHVLGNWSSYADVDVAPVYSADAEEIAVVCGRYLEGVTQEEVGKIIAFLQLRPQEILRVVDQEEIAVDVPIWEHKKRPARYTIRPLIWMGRRIWWGPCSAVSAAGTWLMHASRGTAPARVGGQTVGAVLGKEKALLEEAIVDKALKIVQRYTEHAEKNVRLHRRDKTADHPVELGDYDVLAFLPDEQVVLSIECKDLGRPFCIKDAKTLRETVFGRESGDGHVAKIERRHVHLENRIEDVVRAMKWPVVDPEARPRVVSVHLSREMFTWTRYPPEGINIVFLSVERLAQWIGTSGRGEAGRTQ